jgi:hypothetical protein
MSGSFEVHPERWQRHGEELVDQGEASHRVARSLGSLNIDYSAWGNDRAAAVVAAWAGTNIERWAAIGVVSEQTGVDAVNGGRAYVAADDEAAAGIPVIDE